MGRNDIIIGTWKLVSALVSTPGGESRKLWGENPSGFHVHGDGRDAITRR